MASIYLFSRSPLVRTIAITILFSKQHKSGKSGKAVLIKIYDASVVNYDFIKRFVWINKVMDSSVKDADVNS